MPDVLVVGAGPAGLVAAAVLADRGVHVRIVERGPGPVAQSRAALVHVRTLELLDRLGLVDRAVALGVPTTRVEVHERARPVAEIPLSPRGAEELTPFPFALGLGQDATERLLVQRLGELGVQVEWGTELVALTDGPQTVAAVLRRGGEREQVQAEWVVGADGARSVVRSALGVGFTGRTYDQVGLLADVQLDGAPPEGAVRLHLTRGGFVGMFGLGAGRYRLFGAVPPHLAPAGGPGVSHQPYAEVSDADLRRWFDGYFSATATIRGAEWTALFRVHSRLAERFRVGRTFLVGDAAHIHSPAGGQGMNLAVGDAVNLGWKLACVVRGEAHPGLLDSYPAERRPVARTVLRGADRGFALETATHPAVGWIRAHLAARLLAPLLRVGAVRDAVFRLFSQTWIGYRGSPAVAGAVPRGGVRPGDRAPCGGPRCGLRHQVLLLGPADPGLADAVEAVASRYRVPLPVRWAPPGDERRYGAHPPRFVLVRPDGHVGYAGSDAAGFGAYLDRVYVRR